MYYVYIITHSYGCESYNFKRLTSDCLMQKVLSSNKSQG